MLGANININYIVSERKHDFFLDLHSYSPVILPTETKRRIPIIDRKHDDCRRIIYVQMYIVYVIVVHTFGLQYVNNIQHINEEVFLFYVYKKKQSKPQICRIF